MSLADPSFTESVIVRPADTEVVGRGPYQPRLVTRRRYSSRLSGLSSVRGRVGAGPRTGS